MYFEDVVTYFDKIFMFSYKEKQIDILKGPVKLIKRVKIAHSVLQSVSNQFHVISLSLPTYVVLQMAVKEFFENHF